MMLWINLSTIGRPPETQIDRLCHACYCSALDNGRFGTIRALFLPTSRQAN